MKIFTITILLFLLTIGFANAIISSVNTDYSYRGIFRIIDLRTINGTNATFSHYYYPNGTELSGGSGGIGTETDPYFTAANSTLVRFTDLFTFIITNASVYNDSLRIDNLNSTKYNSSNPSGFIGLSNVTSQGYVTSTSANLTYLNSSYSPHDQDLNTTSNTVFNSVNITSDTPDVYNGTIVINGRNISFYNSSGTLRGSLLQGTSDTLSITMSKISIGNLESSSDIWTTGTGDNLWLGTGTEDSALFWAGANGGVKAVILNATTINENGQNISIKYVDVGEAINRTLVANNFVFCPGENVFQYGDNETARYCKSLNMTNISISSTQVSGISNFNNSGDISNLNSSLNTINLTRHNDNSSLNSKIVGVNTSANIAALGFPTSAVANVTYLNITASGISSLTANITYLNTTYAPPVTSTSNRKVVDRGNATDLEAKIEACSNETIIVPDGVYNLRSTAITVTGDGCTIQGFGKAYINVGNVSGTPQFWFYGSRGSKYAINASVSPGQNYLNLNGISAAVKPGDILLMNGGNEKGTNGNGQAVAKEEVVRVLRTLGNDTVYLESGVEFNYSQAYGSNATLINPIENLQITGLIINGTNPQGNYSWCLWIADAYNVLVTDNEVMNCGLAGVRILSTYKAEISKNNIHDINYTSEGYAVEVSSASKYVDVVDNLLFANDEAFDCAGSGFPSHIRVMRNTISNAPFGIDTHPQCYYVEVTDNLFQNIYNTSASATGYAITPSAMHMTIARNVFRNISRWAIDVNGEINWSGNDRYTYDMVIKDNECYDVGLGCIRTSGTLQAYYNQTYILNNFMRQFIVGGTGISIDTQRPAYVNGNTIIGFTTGISSLDTDILGPAVNSVNNYQCYGNCTHYMYRNSTGHIIIA